MEKGFIKAEIIHYEDFIRMVGGEIIQAKEKGLIHVEEKDYAIKDGNIVHFRFHVHKEVDGKEGTATHPPLQKATTLHHYILNFFRAFPDPL